MFSVVKNVLECFELHLRGSNNLKFSGKPAPNPTSKASFVFIQYTIKVPSGTVVVTHLFVKKYYLKNLINHDI